MSHKLVSSLITKKVGTAFLVLLLGASLSVLPGCGSGNADAEVPAEEGTAAPAASTPVASEQSSALPYTFTDVLGNQVTVTKTDRVVATMGSFAGIWELAGGTLVGAPADGFQSYGIDKDKVASIGDFKAPNLEQIIGLEPDLVILTAARTGYAGAANQVALRETLEASGITTAYFEVTTFEDYLAMLKTCTEMLGTPERYEQYGASVATQIDNIKQQVPKDAHPSVIIMTTFSGGTRVSTSDSQTGVMLKELGAHNIVDDDKSLLKDFSFENVIAQNPDHIFVIPMGNDPQAAEKNFLDQTSQNPAWSTLDAVKQGNVHVLDHNLFLFKPNEEWGQAYQVLFDALYGESSES